MATEEKELTELKRLEAVLQAKLRLAGVPTSVIAKVRIQNKNLIVGPAPNTRNRFQDIKYQDYRRYQNGQFNWKLITIRTKDASKIIIAKEKTAAELKKRNEMQAAKRKAFNKKIEALNLTIKDYRADIGEFVNLRIKDSAKDIATIEFAINSNDIEKVVQILRTNGIVK